MKVPQNVPRERPSGIDRRVPLRGWKGQTRCRKNANQGIGPCVVLTGEHPCAVSNVPYSAGELDRLCRCLGEAMTGGEIPDLLHDAGVVHKSTESTKWRRLRDSLGACQSSDQTGVAVERFIEATLTPARFTNEPAKFDDLREAVNLILALRGRFLDEGGRLAAVQVARTLSEAQSRARGLRSKLESRGVHPDVLSACRAELLEENYFHAILESTKSLADKIRGRTGLEGDGAPLADKAFGRGAGLPAFAFNGLETETEISEHSGLHNLIKGLFGAFRNPTAHELRTKWEVSELDALDLFQTVSLVHRRLDAGNATSASPAPRNPQ